MKHQAFHDDLVLLISSYREPSVLLLLLLLLRDVPERRLPQAPALSSAVAPYQHRCSR
jgi:hypothetical protein